MSYDVHVTRADSWLDAEACPISPDEWLADVRSDPEMRADSRAEAQTREGESVATESAGLSGV